MLKLNIQIILMIIVFSSVISVAGSLDSTLEQNGYLTYEQYSISGLADETVRQDIHPNSVEKKPNSDCPCIRRSIINMLNIIEEEKRIPIIPVMGNETIDSKGKEFWLCFQQNYNNTDNSLSLKFFITSAINTNINISISALNWNKDFSITANKITTVEIPTPVDVIINDSDLIENKGIHITADDEVTIYGLNQMQYTTDAYLALPLNILNISYLVMSFMSVSSSRNQSQFAIVSPYNNVTITIIPSCDTEAGQTAGQSFSIVLNEGDVYQVQANNGKDLTGSVIQSSAPVAVFGGNSCAQIPIGYNYCDHIVEQIPPINTWGNKFITLPLEGRLHGDTWRFLSSQDSTDITINGNVVATLDFADFYETILEEPAYVTTSNPVLVMQYSNGDNWDTEISANGDPFMMLIPPVEQFMTQYTFATPSQVFDQNYLSVTIQSKGVSSILLDGQPVDTTLFEPIGQTGYSGAGIPIDFGSHVIVNLKDYPFGIYSYGFANDDSYGYPGGLSLAYIYEGSGPEISRTQETIELGRTSQPENIPLEISATIIDTIAPFVQSSSLFYRKMTDISYTGILMAEENNNVWTAQIPWLTVQDPGIQYYIYATDGQLSVTDPGINPVDNPYSIAVGTNQLPSIDHVPVIFARPGQDIKMTANISDSTLQIDSAEMLYRIPGGNPVYTSVKMILQYGKFSAIIPKDDVYAGTIEYFIKATDNYGVSGFHGTADHPHIIYVQERSIEVTSPKEGEIWQVRSLQEIRWTSNNVERVKIEYSDDKGTTWFVISDSLDADAKSYSWVIPNTPSLECQIKISDIKFPDVFNNSNVFEIFNIPASIYPVCDSSVVVTDEFWLNIYVGDSINPVYNLYGTAFVLHYDTSWAEIVSPLDHNIVNGGFLGDSDSVWILYTPQDSTRDDSIGLAITRINPNSTISGWGEILRVKFKTKPETPDSTQICFNITSVEATDSVWNPVALTPESFCTMVIKNEVSIWPGDTDNDGVVNQADMLPIGLAWGEKGYIRDPDKYPDKTKWEEQKCRVWSQGAYYTYADANGDSIVDELDINIIGKNWHCIQNQSCSKNLSKSFDITSKGGTIQTVLIGEISEDVFEFVIQVENVKNIFGMGIKIKYPESIIELISVSKCHFFGDSSLFIYHDDSHAGIVGIGICRIRLQGGISGSGSIAKIRFLKKHEIALSSIEIDRVIGMDVMGNQLNVEIKPYQISSSTEISTNIPDRFVLYQNYPNPFNFSTTIRYELPVRSHVILKIYDLSGAEILTLINEMKEMGRHKVIWDGRNILEEQVSSGVYYIEINTDSYKCVKKGLFLK
jgi:hypothetical protein